MKIFLQFLEMFFTGFLVLTSFHFAHLIFWSIGTPPALRRRAEDRHKTEALLEERQRVETLDDREGVVLGGDMPGGEPNRTYYKAKVFSCLFLLCYNLPT